MNLLAFTVPVGAVIAVGENRKNDGGGTNNMNVNNGGGGTNNMNVNNGGGNMPNMPNPDTTAPSTTIDGNDNGDGTITWTITFNEDLATQPAARHFSLEGGGSLGTPSTTGRITTITSTHTENAGITLNFDANGGSGTSVADAASNNAMDNMQTIDFNSANINYLTNIRTTLGGSLRSSTPTSGREYRRTTSGSNTVFEVQSVLAANTRQSYTFTGAHDAGTASNRLGQIISTGNDFIITKEEYDDESGIYAFFTGSNLHMTDGTQSFSVAELTTYSRSGFTPVSQRPSSTVDYEGVYMIAELPASGETALENTHRGTFAVTLNFAMQPSSTPVTNGITRDRLGMQTGALVLAPTASNNNLFTGSNSLEMHNFHFNGMGEFAGTTIELFGGFDGNNAEYINANGRTSSGTTRTLMGIVGGPPPSP